jgi:integration host factor subunit beta
MIKSQLVKKLLSKNPHLIQKDVENITALVLERISSALENDGRVEIRGFGSLSVRKRKSKNGRNPRTGESVFVPEKKAPIFKSGKGLRDRLNYKA